MPPNYKAIVSRGDQTARLLEATEEARIAVREDIYRMWGTTKSDEPETREALYRELHGLQSVEARLKSVVDAGKKAQQELDRGN